MYWFTSFLLIIYYENAASGGPVIGIGKSFNSETRLWLVYLFKKNCSKKVDD